MWVWFHKLGSPPHFYRIAGRLLPWFAIPAVIFLVVGAAWGLYVAPADYQQGDGFRIFYVHVPVSIIASMIYAVMAIAAGIGFIWRMKMAHVVAASCAPIGAAFAFLCLVTGSIWGKPMWGVWWAWDPRILSVLVLFFLFVGVIALRAAFEDQNKGDRAAALLAVIGVVNLPIVRYSVEWWNSIHQSATVSNLSQLLDPSIEGPMYWPFLLMFLGYFFFFAALVTLWIRSEVLRRERGARWTKELPGSLKGHNAMEGAR